jgi:hypothetical protein
MVDAKFDKKQLSQRMSIEIPYSFGSKNWELTATESARILPKIKREENLI